VRREFEKHHIIPKWRCKQLGIDPEFEENYAHPSRKQHALIHWGYRHHDLKPLLEICNPPQWVIDLIPIGNSRDSGAAQLIARGEISKIDNSGKNHPAYGKKRSEKARKNMSIAQTGRKHTKETREKMRKNHLPKKHTKETREKMSENAPDRRGDKSNSWKGGISLAENRVSYHKNKYEKYKKECQELIEQGLSYYEIREKSKKLCNVYPYKLLPQEIKDKQLVKNRKYRDKKKQGANSR